MVLNIMESGKMAESMVMGSYWIQVILISIYCLRWYNYFWNMGIWKNN